MIAGLSFIIESYERPRTYSLAFTELIAKERKLINERKFLQLKRNAKFPIQEERWAIPDATS